MVYIYVLAGRFFPQHDINVCNVDRVRSEAECAQSLQDTSCRLLPGSCSKSRDRRLPMSHVFNLLDVAVNSDHVSIWFDSGRGLPLSSIGNSTAQSRGADCRHDNLSSSNDLLAVWHVKALVL